MADRPVAALIRDLKARGMLQDTLVVWASEFGRTPLGQGTDGRDHHPHAFSIWMAGGGVKSGFTYGATDEFGWHATEDIVHVHDLHATMLHLLGMNHERLTYRFAGLAMRLTGVEGHVVKELLACRRLQEGNHDFSDDGQNIQFHGPSCHGIVLEWL